MPFKKGVKLPFVATVDIAKFAVEAFKDSVGRLKGMEVNIVGEELTPEKVMEILGRVTGREIRFEEVSDEKVEREKGENPFVTTGLAVRVMGRFMKREETEEWGVKLTGLEEFLRGSEEGVSETYLKGRG